jgi:hypothetical protein
MPSLLILPDDILFEIFSSLRNIDDVLHLGRSCHRTYGLLELHRLGIMRSVIVSALTFFSLTTRSMAVDHPTTFTSKSTGSLRYKILL